MFRRSITKVSSRKKLIVLATVAVLLPLLLLTFVQYRSLVALEKQTKVAYKENLRQNLLNVERRVEEKFEGIANRALTPAGNINLRSKESVAELEKYFSGVRASHPEIEQIFVFSHCGCEKETDSYAYVYSNSLLRYEHSDLKNSTKAHNILHAFNESQTAQNFLGADRRFLFRQENCSECSANDGSNQKTYVFYPLRDEGSQKQTGFAGITINENYLRDELLSGTVKDVLNNPDTLIPNCADVVVSISGEKGREIYTNSAVNPQYIIETDFRRPFSNWKAKIGFKDKNLDSLAREGFWQGFAATFLVLVFLFAGIVLTVRATGREVRLAQMKSAFVSNVSHELKTPSL
jgi:hypothetical protein